MANNIDPWEPLREARESLMDIKDPYRRCGCPDCTPATKDTLLSRIDAALVASSADGIVKCEFCKGSGSVAYKEPWSPNDILRDENDNK